MAFILTFSGNGDPEKKAVETNILTQVSTCTVVYSMYSVLEFPKGHLSYCHNLVSVICSSTCILLKFWNAGPIVTVPLLQIKQAQRQ